MNKTLLYKGLIMGMEDMGAIHVKTTDKSVFFRINKGTILDDIEALRKAKRAFGEVGLSLRVKILSFK